MRIEADRPTVAIERERLLGLIGQTAEPPIGRAHTVPRDRLRGRPEVAGDDEDGLDVDLGESLSPLLVLGVIALLLVVFVAATQLR